MNKIGQPLLLELGLLFWACSGVSPVCQAAEIAPNASASLEGKVNVASQPKGKWLPVPIPVSNPTVGSGLQGVVLYLHAPKPGDSADTPTATSGIGGMYTDSDSKVLGIFHSNNFANDKFRIKVLGGAGDLNLDYYGIGDEVSDTRVSYNIKPTLTFAEFMAEIPGVSNHFIGLNHLYVDAAIQFAVEIDIDPENSIELPGVEFDSITSSIGFVYNYDSRDNSFFPRKGVNTSVSITSDDPKWGSQYQFERLNVNYRHYFPLGHKHTLATKLAFTDVDGNPPFYFLSTLTMRGFAAGRYLDNTATSLHLEWRYEFASRWGLNVFGESGKIGDSFENLIDSRSVNSVGVGLRWQPIASKELNLGVDVAKSTDDSALYLRVGEAF